MLGIKKSCLSYLMANVAAGINKSLSNFQYVILRCFSDYIFQEISASKLILRNLQRIYAL